MRTKLSVWLSIVSAVFLCSNMGAQVYETLTVQSGFNADVIANGVGTSASSTNNDIDGAGYCFVSMNFKVSASDPDLTYGLPTNGLINSAVSATPGLSYQMGSYSANNALRLEAVSSSGTLSFGTPKAAKILYLLGTGGSGDAEVDVVVNFTDATSETFSSVQINDWYYGNDYAIGGIGRVNTASDALEDGTGDVPKIYQVPLDISLTNEHKMIQSVMITKVSGGNANVFGFSIKKYNPCGEPANITTSNVTAGSVTVNWTAPLTAPSNGYKIYFSTSNTAPTSSSTASISGLTSTTATINTGVNPATTYYLWVESDCGTGTSGWIGPVSFTTPCLPYTVPYFEDFESTAGGSAAPSCWSYVQDSSFFGAGLVSQSVAYSGSNSYQLQNVIGNTGDSMLVSPLTTDLSDGTNRVKFFAKGNGSGYSLQVGTLSNPTDPSTFTALSTLTLTGNYATYIVNLPVGTNTYLAFRDNLGGDFRDIYIDDISVENIPNCSEPINPVVSAVTSSSANVAWTASATTVTGYQVYYSTSNVSPTASTVLDASNSITSTTVSGALGSLSPNTTYYVWVRSVCSTTSNSVWSSMVSFTTLCATITPSYTNDFTSFPGVCWTIASGGDPTTGPTGPANGIDPNWIEKGFLDSTGGSGAASFYFSWFDRAGWLISPTFNLSGGATYTLSFNYGITDSSNGPSVMGPDDAIKVLMSTDGGATWTVIQTWTAASNISNTSNSFTYPITTTSNQVKFAIYALDNGDLAGGFGGDGFYYDLSIDNFAVTSTLGTSDVSLTKNDVKVYPNPFRDILNISSVRNVKSVAVFDLAGRMIQQIDNPTTELKLGNLKSGMYMLKLQFVDGTSQTVKVIKE